MQAQTRAHAYLSLSGAKRWIACPGSPALESNYPDRETIYAREGTHAHKISEVLLLRKLDRLPKKKFEQKLLELKADPIFEHEEVISWSEMYRYCDAYTARVMEKYSFEKARDPDTIIVLEIEVDLSKYIPEGFGHLDVAIINKFNCWIIDLKFGKGVEVDAVANEQLMCYALGIYVSYWPFFEYPSVTLRIDQPRIDNLSTWQWSTMELSDWGDFFLKPAATLAFSNPHEFKAGDHCRFCRARGLCGTLARYEMQALVTVYADADEIILPMPELLTDEEVSTVLKRFSMFAEWMKSVKEYALDQAIKKNKAWPGMKLVEGRSNRKYTKPDEVILKLVEAGFDIDEISERKPFGITEMTSVTGAQDFEKYLSPLIVKPTGKPTLVDKNDKRPALDSAAAAVKRYEGIVMDTDD